MKTEYCLGYHRGVLHSFLHLSQASYSLHKASCHSMQHNAKTLYGPRLPNCTLRHDWSVGNGASMMRVNSNYGRTYSTVYTVQYNIIYYTDFQMENISGQDITHSAGSSSSWNLPRELKLIHPYHPSSSGHPDTVICQILDPTQQVGRITGQKTCSMMYIYYCCNSYEDQMQMCAKCLKYLKMLFHVIAYG